MVSFKKSILNEGVRKVSECQIIPLICWTSSWGNMWSLPKSVQQARQVYLCSTLSYTEVIQSALQAKDKSTIQLIN